MASKWRAPQNSPDWTDIFTTMKAIEALHSVTVTVSLTAGVFDGPSGFTTIAALHSAASGEASVLGEPVLVMCGEWPCPEHQDYASCLYAALLTMDGKLSSKVWQQMKLPFTAE